MSGAPVMVDGANATIHARARRSHLADVHRLRQDVRRHVSNHVDALRHRHLHAVDGLVRAVVEVLGPLRQLPGVGRGNIGELLRNVVDNVDVSVLLRLKPDTESAESMASAQRLQAASDCRRAKGASAGQGLTSAAAFLDHEPDTT